MGRAVRWSLSFALPITALVLLMAVGVLALHDRGNYHHRDLTEQLVNVTATVSKAWRTGFHFQPRKNWMNDPNGPQFYKGFYHLFYQYDPFAAVWGNITWGHAVSKDLIHWQYVDDAALQGGPDWYDLRGAWSGSATRMKDGSPAMMYTGWSNVSDTIQVQTQNLILPVNASDPLLKYWYKSEANPVIVAEAFIDPQFFRDPTEGWRGKDGDWRILLGGQTDDGGGTAYVYKSSDFVNWTYVKELAVVNGTGMWECPDLYPVALLGKDGLETLDMTPGGKNGLVKHIVKVSLNDQKHDYYTLGTYDEDTDSFKADDASLDVGLGLRYDYGKFYASKTFFDYNTKRRILWGWINESTSDQNAIITGWSGLQGIPRQLYLDPVTKTDLIQLPVEELDGLHKGKVTKTNFNLSAGSVLPIDGVSGAQLDIQVTFYKPEANETDLAFNGTDAASKSAEDICSAGGGAALRGFHGPFGLLVLAAADLQEQTAVYFYLSQSASSTGAKWAAIFCSDQSRSSLQIGVDETTYGTFVHVLDSEEYLTLRTLVDHSIVENFVQGGRATITSRVYPTTAVNGAAQAFIFNNGTTNIEVYSIDAWEMESIDIVQFQQ